MRWRLAGAAVAVVAGLTLAGCSPHSDDPVDGARPADGADVQYVDSGVVDRTSYLNSVRGGAASAGALAGLPDEALMQAASEVCLQIANGVYDADLIVPLEDGRWLPNEDVAVIARAARLYACG